jgi:APA family basic amino acid/polyamine antiporter
MSSLARTFGLRDLTLLIIGSVIGSGIFASPGAVLRNVEGFAGLALMVWFVGGALSLLGALTYGELSAMRPKAGGLYVYIRDCFGHFPAFMFGWTLFLVISSGSVATLSAAFRNYLSAIVPMSDGMGKVISVLMIIVIMLVNIFSTRKSADMQNLTTVIKVGALVVMSGILLALGSGGSETMTTFWPQTTNSAVASGFGAAMISVLWAYEGWQYGTYSAGETINAERNYPLAFLIGLAVLIGVYLLANVAYLVALGPAAATQTDRIASDSMSMLVGPMAAKLITIPILISIFSAANSTVLTAPRVFYAMAQDGLFFKKLSEVHPRFGTPAFAVIAMSVWAAVLSLNGTFQELLNLVVFIGWIFYALAAACVFVYRKREPEAARPYKVPGYPVTPILFIISAAALIVNQIFVQDPTKTIMMLGLVVLGVPAYLIWRSGSKTSAAKAAKAE